MPLSESDEKMERHFADEYGGKEGKKIYYATLNKRINEGRPINSPESKHVAAKRKHIGRRAKRRLRRSHR